METSNLVNMALNELPRIGRSNAGRKVNMEIWRAAHILRQRNFTWAEVHEWMKKNAGYNAKVSSLNTGYLAVRKKHPEFFKDLEVVRAAA